MNREVPSEVRGQTSDSQRNGIRNRCSNIATTMVLPARFRRLLSHSAAPYGCAAIGILLCLPAMNMGFVMDDRLHQFMLDSREKNVSSEWRFQPYDLYYFSLLNEKMPHWVRNVSGWTPWYVTNEHHGRLMRPLSSCLLYFDWLIARHSAVWAHVHSLLWMAALVIVVGAIFRRLFSTTEAATLAMLLFAVEDTHALPAVWIANRNATIAATFGALSLLFHIRWRQERKQRDALLAPLFLAFGLLAGEMAVSITAYFLAYAVFLDGADSAARLTLRQRLVALLPCTSIVAVWAVVYRVLNYGVSGSSVYIDPVGDPSRFLKVLFPRLLALLQAQVFNIEPSILIYLPKRFEEPFTLVALITVSVGCLIFIDLIRFSRLARFFFVGMVASVIPQCATFAHSRLLLIAGIGGLGLIALLITGIENQREKPVDKRRFFWSRRSTRTLAVLAVIGHLGIAPLLMPCSIINFRSIDGLHENIVATLERAALLKPTTTLVFITGPDIYTTASAPMYHNGQFGLTTTQQIRTFGTAIRSDIRIERVDPQSLRLIASDGFYNSFFDRLFIDPNHHRTIGERHQVGEFSLEVRALNDDGYPTELLCSFGRDLDALVRDPNYVFVVWYKDGYRRFEPPPIGQAIEIPGTFLPDLAKLSGDEFLRFFTMFINTNFPE